ncbi:YdaU family protein [Verminephrobacter aporrectodeae]|nr:YdaU family protein [Verminephrobacter aporrectodeae]
MNYYEHHIGDYAEATAHLSFIEDAAYSRLIRKYYAIEKPLPAEIKAVQRIVSARSKDERDAVGAVLEEFFTLQNDGWHNARCDEEIARYKEGASERDQKNAHEKERTRRHREERSRLFAELREFGITPKWDATVTQLREILKRTCNAPETRTGGEQERTCNAPETRTGGEQERTCNAPETRTGGEQERTCNAPETANHTPDTNTHTPDTNPTPTRADAACVAFCTNGIGSIKKDKDESGGDLARANSPPLSRAAEIAILLRKRGAAVIPANPPIVEWADRGVTDEQALRALEIAKSRRAEAGSQQPINAGFLDSILSGEVLKKPAKPSRHHGIADTDFREGIEDGRL